MKKNAEEEEHLNNTCAIKLAKGKSHILSLIIFKIMISTLQENLRYCQKKDTVFRYSFPIPVTISTFLSFCFSVLH